METSSRKWTTVIRSSAKAERVNFSELWRYRDLVGTLVRRDFIGVYQQTVLGPLWCIIKPLLTTSVFTVVFGLVMDVPTQGVPDFLFFLCGTVIWTLFSGCVLQVSTILRSNVEIFGKVYFPRLTVPIATVLSNLIHFAIQFVMLLCFVAYYLFAGSAVRLTPWVLMLPVLVLLAGLFGLGVGCLIASLTVKYRDLAILVSFGLQLWMYATPVVYPAGQIPARLYPLFMLNPMAPVTEAFRYALLGTGHPPDLYLLLSGGVTLAVLALGIWAFNRAEKSFMDVV